MSLLKYSGYVIAVALSLVGAASAATSVASPGMWEQFGPEIRFYAVLIAGSVSATWYIRSYLGRLLGEVGKLRIENAHVAERAAEHSEWISKKEEDIADFYQAPPWLEQVNQISHDLDELRRLNQALLDDLNERRVERKLPPLQM